MAQYFYFEEQSAGVLVTSIEEEISSIPENLRYNAIKHFVQAGGAYCFDLNADHIAAVQAHADISDSLKAVVASYKTGPTVVMLEDFFVDHSSEEVKAIMFHELGHVVNGDTASEPTTGRFVVDLDKELAADSYAAERTSPDAVKQGLLKCLQQQAVMVVKYAKKAKGQDPDKIFAMALKDEMIQKRLSALS